MTFNFWKRIFPTEILGTSWTGGILPIQINELAEWLALEIDKITYDSLYEEGPVFDKYKELQKKYSLPEKPFLFQVRCSWKSISLIQPVLYNKRSVFTFDSNIKVAARFRMLSGKCFF